MMGAALKTLWPVAIAGSVLTLAGPATAHHSEAPHYLLDRTVQLSGTVTRWEHVNPHAYLMIDVGTGADRVAWRCEANSAVVMRRLKIMPTTFKAGDRVTLTVNPPRGARKICNLRNARFPDGRLVDFRGATGNPGAIPPEQPPPARLNTSIFGVWAAPPGAMIAAGQNPVAPRPSGRPSPAAGTPIVGLGVLQGDPYWTIIDKMTPTGRRALAAYDPYRDNPVLRCIPTNRGWSNQPLSITRAGADQIVIQHQAYDAKRVVYMNRSGPPAGAPRSPLGYSTGHWEGGTLVVDVTHFAPSALAPYVVDRHGKLTGLIHSDALHVVERIRFDPGTKQIEVSYTQTDPKYHTAPLPGRTIRYQTAGLPLMKENCQPDATK